MVAKIPGSKIVSGRKSVGRVSTQHRQVSAPSRFSQVGALPAAARRPASKVSAMQQAIDARIAANQKASYNLPKTHPLNNAGLPNAAQVGAITNGSPSQLAKANAIARGGVPAAHGVVPGAHPGAHAPGIPTDDQWLAGDGDYQSQLTNANQDLKDTLTDTEGQRQHYNTTYNDDLRRLGYVQGGGWNTADPNTQSGKAFSNQANDFASRGMLQSSGYGTALSNTTRQFDQQVTDATTAQRSYSSGLDSLNAAKRSETQATIAQMKQAAIGRKAAQYANQANGAL